MLGGLACQVTSLLVFACACAEYALRLFRGREGWNLTYKNLYTSTLFKGFLIGLGVATLTILVVLPRRRALRRLQGAVGEQRGLFHGTGGCYDNYCFTVPYLPSSWSGFPGRMG